MFAQNNKTKLIYSVMFLLALGLLSSATVAYLQERSSLLRTAQEKQLIKANAASAKMTQWLKHNLKIIANFSNILSSSDETIRNNTKYQFFLKQAVQTKHFHYLGYGLESDGYFWSYDWPAPPNYDPRERPWYKASKQTLKPFITWPYKDFNSDKLYVAMTAPIIRENRFAGVVSGDISLSYIEQTIQNIKLDMDGKVFLTDRNGKVLVHQGAKRTEENLSELLGITADEATFSKDLLVESKIDTESYILSISPIAQSDWVLVFALSKEKINATVVNETISLLSSFLVIFISISGIFYVSNRHIFSPMMDLLELDSITGLANRNSFKQRVTNDFLKVGREGTLLIIRIDEFSRHAEAYPSAVTHDLMNTIKDRIQEELSQTELLGLFSEDSFVAYLPMIGDEVDSDRLLRMKSIAENLSQYYMIDDQELNCTFKLSACNYPHHGDNIDQLMKHAFSVIATTNIGKSCNVQIYSPNISQQLSQQSLIENALRNALRKSEFHLVYQPQYDLIAERFTSVEALIRWNSSELGRWVSPADFIPIAESTNLIIEIGDFVSEMALHQFRSWKECSYDIDSICINISPKELLQENFLVKLMDRARRYKVSPNQIELEVTETSMMDNPEEAIAILREIRSAGFSIAVDDFGTGFSSLEYLKSMPIDKLKVDRAFVSDLEHSEEDRAIVSMIMELSKALKLRVLAEGVETLAQAEFLSHAGYQMIQGYYYSKPIPHDEISASLFSSTKRVSNL